MDLTQGCKQQVDSFWHQEASVYPHSKARQKGGTITFAASLSAWAFSVLSLSLLFSFAISPPSLLIPFFYLSFGQPDFLWPDSPTDKWRVFSFYRREVKQVHFHGLDVSIVYYYWYSHIQTTILYTQTSCCTSRLVTFLKHSSKRSIYKTFRVT